jgi:hypothetical protein
MSNLRVLFLSTFLVFFVGSCQKESISYKAKSNLSEQQEAEIIEELVRLMKEGAVEDIPANRAFLEELHEMANDIESLYEGVDELPDYEAKYHMLRANMRARVDEVIQKAEVHYNGSRARTILSINSFVLAGYGAFSRQAPEFMWTKLGIFAANEVRGGIILGYLLKHILEINKFHLVVNEITGLEATDMLDEVAEILIEGQQSVFIDIGALALLNRYGPENLKDEPWLGQDARNGYAFQEEAENALAEGNISKYQDLQTLAAVEFGAHEQLYVLDAVWDRPLMHDFNAINQWMLSITNNQMALFADIFVGVNKFTELPKGWVITFPRQYNDLTQGIDRVEIARNGFHTLNSMRKETKWHNWIEDSQKRLGKSKGVYNIKVKLN